MEGAPRGAGRGPVLERGIPRRFSTRGRLYFVFGVLAAALALGFALQLLTLERMGSSLERIEGLDEAKGVALALEDAVREHYLRRTRALEEPALAAPEPRDDVERLAIELEANVAEPEARAAVARVRAAVRALDRAFDAAPLAPAPWSGAQAARWVQRTTHERLFEAEEAVDELIALLQAADAETCAAVARVRRSTRHLALAFLLGLPIAALGLTLHLSRSIARPLRRLGEGAGRIAAGDLGTRVDAGGPEEFDVLAAQVNAMAAALKRGQEELVRAETLAGLGRMAAGIAHELNNPLQVLLGYLSLHRDRVGGALGRDLARMEGEAVRCREIVGALLRLARPPVAQMPAVPVDVREVALDVADAVRVALGGRAAAFHVVGQGRALGSPLAVRQILVNLARNAAEASGPAGSVEIRIGTDGARATVSVSDDGPGVPPDDRERVFDPFFTTKPTGTGLGLPMARSLASALGGDLALEAGEGGGARFTLRLPLAQARRRA